MKKLILVLFVILLSSCSNSNQSVESLDNKLNRFESLEELKEAFVEAGGQCWGWRLATLPEQLENTLGIGDCDSKTVLIVYEDYIDVEQEALNGRRHNEGLGFKTSYLFGDNWFINSDQVVSVYPKMGGTLMTR